MDINEQLQSVVTGLVADLKVNIEQELREKVSSEVIAKLASKELDSIVSDSIKAELSRRLETFNFTETSKTHLNKIVSDITQNINRNLAEQARNQIIQEVSNQIARIDILTVVNEIVKQKLESIVKLTDFPARSIPHTSVNFENFKMSGDAVKGGIIENFGSTGIEDLSTKVQMTVMDTGVAFETSLFAPEIKVRGNVTVDGNLNINGQIPTDSKAFTQLVDHAAQQVKTNINDELFNRFSHIIYKEIAEKGIDLNQLSQGGREIVKENRLGYHITDTNIQRVGQIRDLLTVGDTFLSDTLYASGRRVGVNTIDPSAALSVWDEEVEFNVGKRKQDVVYVGTPRSQQVILGSNSKENIRLDTDGAVEIENLRVGNVPMSSASAVPDYAAITGTIVWNEAPGPGSAIGWVCLGGTRWAKFGTVE